MIKATRTLWLVVLMLYNRHAISPFSKTPAKTGHFLLHTSKVCTVEDSGCLPPTTPYFWLARSTIRNSVLTAIPVGPFER